MILRFQRDGCKTNPCLPLTVLLTVPRQGCWHTGDGFALHRGQPSLVWFKISARSLLLGLPWWQRGARWGWVVFNTFERFDSTIKCLIHLLLPAGAKPSLAVNTCPRRHFRGIVHPHRCLCAGGEPKCLHRNHPARLRPPTSHTVSLQLNTSHNLCPGTSWDVAKPSWSVAAEIHVST